MISEQERAERTEAIYEKYRPLAARAMALAEAGNDKIATASNVVRLGTKVAQKPHQVNKEDPFHINLGKAVIYVIRDRSEDFMFTEKGAYWYSDGLWTMTTDANRLLNVEIECGAKAFNHPSSIKLINETREWIKRDEGTNRKGEIPWDAHGLVPTKSGLVNPRNGKVRPIRPEDYCTWRVEAEYDPAAKCPWWLMMLNDVFADRPEDERGKTICVIQELLGAGLLDDKPRELSRALVFQGGSNFGKSGLLDVLSGLFGRDVNSASIESLEGDHGTMPFIKRRPWVLHEAFDQRKWHFSSKVKEIVTGDPINVNIKNGPMLTIRITAPIFWGTNHPPQFKEATKAITNRLVVIECRREFLEDSPVGAAAESRRRGLGKPSNMVLKHEMPGLLAWAMEGLRRALDRGRLVLTKSMADTIDEMRRDSNMVAGFVEECCDFHPDQMISSADFCLAFSAWWQQNRGETYSPPSNEVIGKSVAAMANPKIATGLKDTHRRYYGGLMLNATGESYHAAGAVSHHLEAKKANTTGYDSLGHALERVNKLIPAAWDTKPEVIAMRPQHMTATKK